MSTHSVHFLHHISERLPDYSSSYAFFRCPLSLASAIGSAAAPRRRMSALRQHDFGPNTLELSMPDTAAPPSLSTVEVKIRTVGNGSSQPSSPRSERSRSAMHKKINKVAVLGAGTMGARIAAHLANAGIPCLLLDIVPPAAAASQDRTVRNQFAIAGV